MTQRNVSSFLSAKITADARDRLCAEHNTVAPEQVLAIACDITDRTRIDAAIEQTVDRFGGLDITVNDYGGPLAVTFADATESQWADCIPWDGLTTVSRS